ncbi:long-chain-fatty-acid--[acyl-carrier-protein] ligase AEE15, chloroplastic-like isoform X2 [Typha latifolia]|uniref:long-chain-fatty-acid--[acyl-carrier-protein] ligase AEE15, chloroplastic-like isoform X2 n=1 Tax=Typha latifolia TaxID=4733 RepID=UPI003C2CEED8
MLPSLFGHIIGSIAPSLVINLLQTDSSSRHRSLLHLSPKGCDGALEGSLLCSLTICCSIIPLSLGCYSIWLLEILLLREFDLLMMIQMAMFFHSKPVLGGFDRPRAFVVRGTGISRAGRDCIWWRRRARRARVFCSLELQHPVRRRYSPFLDNALLPGANELVSDDCGAVPDIWKSSAEKYGDRVALVDPYHEPPSKLSYKQLEQEILNFSEGLRVVGVIPDEKLALFADNSCRWLVADQGIMATGAINVVRGTRSADEELLQIYTHSESVALVVDSPQFFNRLAESFILSVDIRFVVLLWGEKSCLNSKAVKDIPLYDYSDIIELGRESRNALLQSLKEGQQYVFETINPDDVATLMYTSGTSDTPKGVMLTHRNLLHQIKNLWDIVPAKAGDRFLSMLPTWHAYERASEYFIFTYGVEQVYTNIKYLKDDLKRYQPQYLISVPLVYETLYSSIQKQIHASSAARKFVAFTLIKISLLYMEAKRVYEGKFLTEKHIQPSSFIAMIDWFWGRTMAALLWPLHKLAKQLVYNKIYSAIGISQAGISGGGSLPLYVDRFFEAIDVKLQNGYGLTETSPVVAARQPACNVLGTVGHPLKYTEIKVVDVETGAVLPDGSKGIVKIKGPQVMKGYYKNPSATSEAMDEDGWFNTGDIGWIAPKHAIGRSRQCGGMLVLEGRAKDTIVLSTGENVEPAELEAAATRSSLIHQIVVVGQDGWLFVSNWTYSACG